MRPKVVFSDIDGTLIDTFTHEYGQSIEILRKLKEASIPVVLCSSKTRAEQEAIRKDLNLEDEPFIVENGGAIIIPKGYFKEFSFVDGLIIIELGGQASEIQRTLNEIRKDGIVFKGVSDVSIDQLAEIVGMTHDEASRMSMRRYGETILEINISDKNKFENTLREKGLTVVHGGRYFDVTFGNDKGKAVKILSDLYRKKMGDETVFVGVGDSPNDVPMLKSVDLPIIVQMYNGVWTELDIPEVIRVNGIGPSGWENVFVKIMEEDR